MKKLIALLLALSVTTAYAQHGHYRHGHGGGGNWIAPLIVGGAIGVAIASRSNQQQVIVQQPPPYYPPIYQPQTYSCLVQVYDPVYNVYRNEVMVCGR